MNDEKETNSASAPDSGRMLLPLPEECLEFVIKHYLKQEEPRYVEYLAQRASSGNGDEASQMFHRLVLLQRWLDRKDWAGECDHFGSCPHCLCDDGYLNIVRGHWFFCMIHRTKWCAGGNLFSSWRHQSEAEWRSNCEYLADFTPVEPVYQGEPEA
jgi:hypothetical protein